MFELIRNNRTINFLNRYEIKTGCSVEKSDRQPEVLGCFESRQEALEELKKHTSSVRKEKGTFTVEEYYVRESEEGDIIEFAEMKIDVIQKPTAKTLGVFDNYAEAESFRNNFTCEDEVYIDLVKPVKENP